MRIHLDTDIGGDIDDLCALAMLLRWSGVEITGITTVAELGGQRAAYVRAVLKMEGREDIPVAAGVEVAQGAYRYSMELPDEARYWPEPVAPAPGPVEAALDLLENSLSAGAQLVGIGPFTNLALLERRFPGSLSKSQVTLMGGYLHPVRPGFPAWGNEMDFNVQSDVASARTVLEHSNPTLVPLSVTVETALRRAYLVELRKAGDLGRLLARQAEAFAQDEGNETRFGATCPGLPADIINFQHDPLACAVALGWQEGVDVEELPILVEERDGWLSERVDKSGRLARVVTKIDGLRFSEFWLGVVTKG